MKRAHTRIAENIGWDTREVFENRYQTYTNPMVYTVGDYYYAVSVARPKHDVGGPWEPCRDQFGVQGTNLTVWRCKAGGS